MRPKLPIVHCYYVYDHEFDLIALTVTDSNGRQLGHRHGP
jgi:hypothetical protein